MSALLLDPPFLGVLTDPQDGEVPVPDDDINLPPGHPERRQVSNEILAFQIQTLQDSSITGHALIREQIKDGFSGVNGRLDKHDGLIADLREQLIKQNERTTVLEDFKREQERMAREENKSTQLSLQSAQLAAGNDRMTQFLIKAAMGMVLFLGAAIGVIKALGGLG
jgi:ABC-type multidrug transport system fused ATPase/permease subunit